MAGTRTKKPDRRVIRTRKAIMSAFDRLVSNDEKITVSAIAREAGIDRKTFYLHYKSIDDLANHKAEEALEQVLSVFKTEGTGKLFPERMHIILMEVNALITSDVAVYASIASRLSTDQVLEHFEQAMGPALLHLGFNSDITTSQQLQMRLQFFIAGSISLYATWLRSDRSQPIETVSTAIEEAIWPGRP